MDNSIKARDLDKSRVVALPHFEFMCATRTLHFLGISELLVCSVCASKKSLAGVAELNRTCTQPILWRRKSEQ